MWNFKRESYKTYNPDAEPPTSSFYYVGIYEFGDEAHPDGGTIVYIDEFDVEQTITDIVLEDGCVEYIAKSITSSVGLSPCTP